MGKGGREGVEVLGPNVKPGAESTEWIAKTKNQKQHEQASPAPGVSPLSIYGWPYLARTRENMEGTQALVLYTLKS